MNEYRECQFCGSLACEWDGLEQIGCSDCGYEHTPEPSENPARAAMDRARAAWARVHDQLSLEV